MSVHPCLSDAVDALLRQLAAASNRLPARHTSAVAVDSGMRMFTVTHPDVEGWTTPGNWQAMHELEGQGLVTQHENPG